MVEVLRLHVKLRRSLCECLHWLLVDRENNRGATREVMRVASGFLLAALFTLDSYKARTIARLI